MEKTFQKEDLAFIGNVLSDVRSVREGKLESYMLSEDNAKRIRVFSTGPEHNCCITLGNTDVKEPVSELFTFQPEDVSTGIRNSEGHITLTASLKNKDMKFKSNNRNAYRALEIGADYIRTRLTIHDKPGQLLFKMKPTALIDLINAMTLGFDAQSQKTSFSRFILKEKGKLEYYKYSTDSTAIFGYINIDEGNITHDKLTAFDGAFYIPDAFHSLLNTIVTAAYKDESGRLVEFYYNGSSITIKYTNDRDISVSLIYDGVSCDQENIDMINKMRTKFDTKFADVTINTIALLETLSDIEATTNNAPCVIEFKDNNAHVRSTTMVNKEPVYSNILPDVCFATTKDSHIDVSKFRLPIITSSFKKIIDTYQKFDIEENDQIVLHLYELISNTAGKKSMVYLTEVSSERYTGRLVAQPC